MKTIAFSILLAGIGLAQTNAIDILNDKNLLTAGTTLVVSVKASQGDGSVCNISKIAFPTINFVLGCVNADGSVNIPSHSIRPGAGVGLVEVSSASNVAGVACFILMNPTAAQVTMGSFLPVPAGGISYQCTSNIVATGGQTPIVAGTAKWP